MRKCYYLITLTIFLLSSIAYSAGVGSIDKGSISILVKHDSVTIALMDQNGMFKEATFGKDGFEDAESFIQFSDDAGALEGESADFHVHSELIIDGDKITIDGRDFSCDEIEKLSFSNQEESRFSFRARLPRTDYDFGREKKINVDRKSSSDKFGFGDLIVEAGETIYGDVVAVTGDVKVYGEVMGDVVAVFGDIEMHDGSSAGGDLVAPFGKVIKRGHIEIGGDTMPRDGHYHYRNTADFDFTARYNRVEGITLLSGIHYTDKHRELPDFNFDFGYAFSLKRWNFDAGFRQQFADKYAFYFGANVFRGAVTSDEWMFSYEENTAATLLFKEDFHDFYHEKGFKGYMGQHLGRNMYFQVEFFAQENESLVKTTNKAIFGGKKNFRENYSTVAMTYPEMLESIDGKRRMLAFSFNWDNRDDENWPRSGQYVNIRYESAGDGQLGNLGGDQSFDVTTATIANYIPLTRKQHIGLRMQAGHSDQLLPLDKWFFLGGVGSLRGYDFKEFAGNRYFLANLDYYFEFSSGFSLALFGDLGKAGFSETEFKDNDLKSNVGVGVIFEDAFRLDIAQRMDDTDKNPVVRGRFMLHF